MPPVLVFLVALLAGAADAGPAPGGRLTLDESLVHFYDADPVPDAGTVVYAPLPVEEGVRRWDLSFERWDGEAVHARLARAETAEGNLPLILYFHRYVESRAAADDVARALPGFAVLACDHPQKRRKSAVQGRDLILERVHLSRDAVLDARHALGFVRERDGIDGKSVVAMGGSQGAPLAVLLTALHPEILGVVSIVGGVSPEGQKFRGLTVNERKNAIAAQLLRNVDARVLVPRVSPRPLLMVNGTKDQVISRAEAEALFQAAGESKQQIWIEAGHLFPFATLVPHVRPWLKEHVGR